MILIDNDCLTDKGKITALNHHNSSICSDIAVIEKKCFSVPWTERSIESQVFTEGSINAVIRDDKAENKPVALSAVRAYPMNASCIALQCCRNTDISASPHN